jgi:hypothetical protein
MLVRRLAALLLVASIGGGLTASSAYAVYIRGATYTGQMSSGGSVTVGVSDDGGFVTRFWYEYLPIGCNTSLSERMRIVSVPISNDTFSFSGENDIAYTGTFTGPQTVTGTLVWNGPFCVGQHPTVTWAATTSTPFRADVGLALSASPDPIVAGGYLTYTATVSHTPIPNGASAAPAVILTQTVPDGSTFVSASPSQGSCTETSGVVTCALGAIPSGGTATATLTVVAERAGDMVASGTVTSGAEDPAPGDNSATVATTVQSLCVVPNVVGKTLAAAEAAIARGHCRTGKIVRVYSKKVRKGRVVSQRPAPKARLLPAVAVVKLVVSRGPKPKR